MIRYVMPWKADGPLDLTLLRAPDRRLTKRITPDAIEPHELVSLFEVDAVRLEGFDDVPVLLLDLAGRADTCGIRGVLKREFADRPKVLRRIHDHPNPARPGHMIVGPFVEVPRRLVMIDLEPDTCPAWVDPTDPVLVGGYLRRQLPPALQMARCCVQLSSGAGIKRGLRAHLWFALSRPLTGAELSRWLGKVAGLDNSTFRPVQPHYCAAPVFDGGADDPCHERLAILPGLAEVQVPDLTPERPRQAFAPASFARSGGGAEAFAYACLRRLAVAPEGRRHPTCVSTACTLLAIAKAGQLDPIRVASMIKGVMAGKGFGGRSDRSLDEVDRILEWAWRQVEPRRLA